MLSCSLCIEGKSVYVHVRLIILFSTKSMAQITIYYFFRINSLYFLLEHSFQFYFYQLQLIELTKFFFTNIFLKTLIKSQICIQIYKVFKLKEMVLVLHVALSEKVKLFFVKLKKVLKCCSDVGFVWGAPACIHSTFGSLSWLYANAY